MRRVLLAAVAAASMSILGAPATAEVKSATDGRLALENIVVIDAAPDRVYAALGHVGDWWESSHTYSGNAANMTMKLEPGACFCEALPGGGVKHGEVVLALPEKTLRIHGALGPLQDLGVAAALTFELKPTVDGKTQVVQSYKASGLDAAMLKNAALIDMVVGTQLKRLKVYVETGKAG